MKPDPRAEAKRWRDQAFDDLEAARHNAAGGFHAQACFLAQQSAGKAIKAIYYARGARSVLGHSVAELIDSLEPAVPELAALRPQGVDLDLFYIPTRYPNGLAAGTPASAFSKEQSDRAVAAADAILRAVDRNLGT